MVVLGISLGSRTTGLAVIKDNELLVARSLTIRNKHTTSHTETVGSYIRQYKILIVAIKMPPLTHITERLKDLLRQFAALFEYHGCMVEYKGTADIKRLVPDVKNKLDLIRFAAVTYPDLTPLQDKELAIKQRYHVKMFEAVVIAHLRSMDSYPPN